MTIGVIFQLASETIEVRIDNTNVYFRTTNTNGAWATIDNMKLNYVGVCREHPDLELAKDWREQAIKRFKEKINKMNTEKERTEYIIQDLKKFGYKPLWLQRQGFRPEAIK